MTLRKFLGSLALASLVMTLASSFAGAEEAVDDRFDGLKPVANPRVQMAFVDPDADFSVFKRVSILDPFVAFRSNWQRDQNRSRARNVRASDMERIKTDVANLFRDVFIERLQDAGIEITTGVGEDVLIVRPAVIDLDITAPDVGTSGRSRTYTTTNGAATLYIELFDAESGDIIGRAADRQVARQASSFMTWNNRVTNASAARRMFSGWADKLAEFLEKHYGVKPSK